MDNHSPLISVIIPTHNRSDLLNRAVTSVVAQTFANFQLIIADDASDDDTETIAGDWALRDKRLQYYRSDKNVGAAAIRNRAVELAKADYICFLDDDDEWDCRKLEIQYEFKDSGSIVGCLSKRTDGFKVVGINFSKSRSDDNSSKYSVDDVMLEDVFFNNGGLSPSNVMVRKKYFLGVGGFDESLVASQGRDLFVRLIYIYGKAKLINLQLVNHYQAHGVNRISDSKNHVIGGWMELKKNRHMMSYHVYHWRLASMYMKEFKFEKIITKKVYWFAKAIKHVRFWRPRAYVKLFLRALLVR